MLVGHNRTVALSAVVACALIALLATPYTIESRVSDAVNALMTATGSPANRDSFVDTRHIPIFLPHSVRALNGPGGEQKMSAVVTSVQLDSARLSLYWEAIMLTALAGILSRRRSEA